MIHYLSLIAAKHIRNFEEIRVNVRKSRCRVEDRFHCKQKQGHHLNCTQPQTQPCNSAMEYPTSLLYNNVIVLRSKPRQKQVFKKIQLSPGSTVALW